ncbi:bifunctional cobalt-precorrin-7 (C(5))-methyltransferase/cobalt-precorrin-6B (C(15))-methyltransferase [Saccharopolyspora erythraea]|uniref:Precorrin-6Y C(5,15)-methyltransferase (Decarboxylating) n=2 Tax=Saccharopolyspora erythraea TaxID=1836 RepID=A4FM52_SACEN|nr:bifunctional cobalt-precorrin-7 (C(5))-methyltransferase/cobalt-precorrin-6B (C(15))-methyltransferase [Saccharopolyspora erythraea]EQD84608.1 precorrin-6Y C5,15-methyltransferase [Saccharopolyspora erythraea D]QRK93908.1 bifunctional cobalt-precorrin-7 (C(5))-methyltransferase/cobalt-precorrin-6B (C(15))-methyltransferase [Saccharopolyspora erythraea]CAM05127.1 precorrin-6Y C(5,15)-methyltransferase (decarboxylating) [Saccharopolyspora erythraea NRRL 2338]
MDLDMPEFVDVVGIGADGWEGLAPRARRAVASAEVLFGSSRQLDLVPEPAGRRVAWPSPLLPALPGLLAEHAGRSICVLASGDPMFYGIGATLVRLLGPDRLRVLPHPSSLSLACARMGWPVQETAVVSLVGRPVELLHPAVQPDNRVLVLSADGATPAAVAALLTARGYGASELTVLADLGGEREERISGSAATWDRPGTGALNVVAVRCRAEPSAAHLPRVPGLPDDAFEHDGQLTKRDVRASTLARLAPAPGQLLWDVGAGAGSIAIEWMRGDPANRAIAVEHREDRAARIARNATALGVPGLRVVTGAAPRALAGLETPDAIFVGGGATAPGVLETCWDALAPGGRLVVNAVTMESEVLVADRYGALGGELVRISVDHASPVGGFTGWRPSMRVTQWAVRKPAQDRPPDREGACGQRPTTEEQR